MQRSSMSIALLALLTFTPTALSSAAQDRPAVLQIRAKSVLMGDGTRIEDGLVVVADGKIRSVGAAASPDPELPLIDHPGVLSAGMVLAHTWFGVAGENHDSTRPMLEEARLAYAYRPDHSDFRRALEAGITTLVLAPTGQNLAGGQTCVVKTNGALLKKEGQLALSFSKQALSQGVQQFFFFFDATESGPMLDEGLEESGGRESGGRMPTSYGGSLALLEERIQADEGAFARARRGELPVLLEAWDRNEVARAADFAAKHRLKGALRGGPLAGDLASAIRASGLGVVLGPFEPGVADNALRSAADLAKAGVPLAFSLGPTRTACETARFGAAQVLAGGVPREAAWKALTADAAMLAGLEDRVGRLEPGLDADLVLWSGDPLDLTSSVEAVFLDGRSVFGGKR
jgi:imidazolonepropionase-like amidohydrolase